MVDPARFGLPAKGGSGRIRGFYKALFCLGFANEKGRV
jgi:hypothetical protein